MRRPMMPCRHTLGYEQRKDTATATNMTMTPSAPTTTITTKMKVSDLDAFKAHLSKHPETVKELTSFTKKRQPPPSTLLNSSSSSSSSKTSCPVRAIQWAVHLCLASVFVVHCLVYTVSDIHDAYFVTILQRAKRTDADLKQEFTYYDRGCNLADISAGTQAAHALLLDKNNTATAIDQMMLHGAGMMPELLPLSTVQDLRAFVFEKNAAIKGTSAEYPMSTGHQRISYGIEATEDPRVISALKQLHANSFLKDLLQDLVGPNPSLTEITAITASIGCEHQNWHADVKSDGNAMQFGQTYSHSYSLFIPLQDTTGAMGATDLCPGTHYCGDELHDICESSKVGLHEIMGGGVWRAGDGFLLNQQVWHRGTAHTDPAAGDRMVFIVSFLARPVDQRQLSRGTYFHMKWNMWGHTWQDLGDAAVSMAWPFNILRCLHLWKPKGREWGYDLFTSASMRIANNQMGCEPEDLYAFLSVLDGLGFPEWLDGTIDTDTDQAWPLYIRETLANYKWFMLWVQVGVLTASFALALAWAVRTQYLFRSGGPRVIRNAVGRVLVTHGLVVSLTLFSLDFIHSSEWGKGLASNGKTLMRPFPPVQEAWLRDPFVSKGLTTMPFRHDVLVGTRLDSESLGAYARWLDYHPGNRVFRDYVSMVGGQLYRSYEQGLPPIFHQHVLDEAVAVIASTGGRFLEQDYRTGDWRHMTKSETRAHVRLIMTTGTHIKKGSVQANIKRQIDFLLGKYRFDMLPRNTSLSRISQSVLHQFKTKLFGTLPKTRSSSSKPVPKQSTRLPSIPSHLPNFPIRSERHQPMVASNRRWHSFDAAATLEEVLYVGKEVALPRGNTGRSFPVTIIDIHENGKCDVALYGKSAKILHTVKPSWLLKRMLPMEGGRVQVLLDGEWFFGMITRVRPDGALDVDFDDGDVLFGTSNRYILVPDEL